jgi:hypothetical protein
VKQYGALKKRPLSPILLLLDDSPIEVPHTLPPFSFLSPVWSTQHLYPDDGGSMFPWNVLQYLSYCTGSHPKKLCLHSHRRESLKSYRDYWDLGLCPSSGILTNTAFRKWDLLPSSGAGWETSTLLGPLEWGNPNYWQLATYFQADILFGLFDLEDGGDIFLRNVGWLSTDYTASFTRRQHSSSLL